MNHTLKLDICYPFFFSGVNLFAWSNFDSDNLIDAIFYQITGPGAKINISHSTPQGNIETEETCPTRACDLVAYFSTSNIPTTSKTI